MPFYRRLSIVVPAYDEEATIGTLLDRAQSADIRGLEREIIVVDDGSRDRTAQIASGRAGVRVISHRENGGKGRALKTGFEAATGDVILIQDADLEYDPADYAAVLAPILDGRADAVLGERRENSALAAPLLGNAAITALTNFLYGARAEDYEAGTKAFARAAVADLKIEADGFEYDNELVCRLLRLGRRVAHIPVAYRPRGYAEGKKIRLRDGLKMLWTVVKWRLKNPR